jgi:hypothetical protein
MKHHPTPRPPRRAVYEIDGEPWLGVEFVGRLGLYLWAVVPNKLFQWTATGWTQIPIDQLGARRRAMLLQVWQPTKSK